MASKTGDTQLRAENVSKALKGFGLKKFKLKQVLLSMTSTSSTESYWRETAAELSASGEGFSVQGVARGATFPHVDPSWTRVSGRHIKFAAEGLVMMEDRMLNEIAVQARTILRVARAITNQIDAYIYTELSGASGINTAATSAEWDSATVANRDPINDILKGIQYMDDDNYDVLENGYLIVNPNDYRSIISNSKVINNPSYKTADVVSNGIVGQICGLKIIKTTSVTDDEAMIIIGQRAATWQSAIALTSAVIKDEGIKDKIRSWEMGHVQVTDPEAIHIITNTTIL